MLPLYHNRLRHCQGIIRDRSKLRTRTVQTKAYIAYLTAVQFRVSFRWPTFATRDELTAERSKRCMRCDAERYAQDCLPGSNVFEHVEQMNARDVRIFLPSTISLLQKQLMTNSPANTDHGQALCSSSDRRFGRSGEKTVH